jgi:hypothetical protein
LLPHRRFLFLDRSGPAFLGGDFFLLHRRSFAFAGLGRRSVFFLFLAPRFFVTAGIFHSILILAPAAITLIGVANCDAGSCEAEAKQEPGSQGDIQHLFLPVLIPQRIGSSAIQALTASSFKDPCAKAAV